MPIRNPDDLFAALRGGNEGDIKGTPESEWLDAKGSPYVLIEEHQKIELAKDVSALANSGGGVILIGAKTEKVENSRAEIISKIVRFPPGLVNVQQYRDLIEQYTYPPLRDVELESWLDQGGNGIVTVRVRAAKPNAFPVVVTSVQDQGLRRNILLGVFERSSEGVGRFLPSQVHTWIQLGHVLQQSGGTSSHLATSASAGPTDQEREERLRSDMEDTRLEGSPRLVLQAWPRSDVRLKEMHSAGGLGELLSRPPQIRAHGFGLRTGRSPTTLPSGGLRIMAENLETLSLQRDGLLTWVNVELMSRAVAIQDPRRGVFAGIHPWPITEATLEFCRFFVGQVLPRCHPRPTAWSVTGGLFDLVSYGRPMALPNMPIGHFNFPMNWTFVPTNIPVRTINLVGESAGEVAYLFLEEIYSLASIDESVILFKKNGEISEDLLKEADSHLMA